MQSLGISYKMIRVNFHHESQGFPKLTFSRLILQKSVKYQMIFNISAGSLIDEVRYFQLSYMWKAKLTLQLDPHEEDSWG